MIIRLLNRVPASPGRSLTGRNGLHLQRRAGLSRYAFALILMLPIAAWSGGNSTTDQGPVVSDPVADQVDITGDHDTHRATSAKLPATGKTTQTENESGHATSGKYDLALGKSVFTHTCLTCHGNSVLDAPRIGDLRVWQPRLAQGLDVLIDHALNGHGRMPAKGGYNFLTDYEVSSAVAYVYQVGTGILGRPDSMAVHAGCDPVSNLDQCTPEELQRLLVLQMLWLLGGPR
jgi:cytochrome c5